MIYLDNAATTKMDERVLDKMIPYMQECYGNPGGSYKFGRAAKEAVEHAREQVANFIGAKPNQIFFTSGGTEGNNLIVMNGVGLRRFACSSIEHDSILNSAEGFGNRMSTDGICPKYIKPDQEKKIVTLDCVRERVKSYPPGMVSVMHTNNETGMKNEVEAIGEWCHENGWYFHTDCVQAAGCEELNVDKLHCDYLTLSSHKIHGGKGCGAIYIRNPFVLEPVIYGGRDQEGGMRGGTENVPGIVAFGEACEITQKNLAENIKYIHEIKSLFYNELKENLLRFSPEIHVEINGVEEKVLEYGKVLNLYFPGIDGETLRMLLDVRGVCVSAGSACTSNEQKPSHVLKAIGYDDERAMNSIRVSFSRMNTREEVIEAAGIIAEEVARLLGKNPGGFQINDVL